MQVDHTRSENLTDFSKATLTDRYLLPEEEPQDLFARVAKRYSNDDSHAQRLYDYMSNLWFMPATPILSNGGTTRGLPISCFLSEAQDDMDGIVGTWNENTWLACKGGGIGSYWGNIRSLGEKIGRVGKSSGVIPFLKVQDSLTLAVSQGSLRRGSSAIFMPINHPEIEEFIEIRRPSGGDPNRRTLNLHHGVVVDDVFMLAVKNDTDYNLVSPKDKTTVIETVKARDLWQRLLIARVETGEPYIVYIDNVNKAIPQHHKDLGLLVKTSNLCVEITLPTGPDHHGVDRTAVCCLSSLNLEKYYEWKDDKTFILDVMYFLDNVLQDFIDNAPDTHAKAKYGAMRERSVGLGVMGLHYLYQSLNLPYGSDKAASLNLEIFGHIKNETVRANELIGKDRGSCPDAADAGYSNKRFSNCTAIAPTASISVICGGSSPGIEPVVANTFTHKTLSGSFTVRNPHLTKLLGGIGKDTAEVWSSIALAEGSVQHLDFLSQEQKEVFKTFKEMEQMDIINQAAARQPYIDQSQSTNIYLPADVSKRYLSHVHMKAWELGLKTLYYVRSNSIQRAEKPSEKVERVVLQELNKECKDGACPIDFKPAVQEVECEACQ